MEKFESNFVKAGFPVSEADALAHEMLASGNTTEEIEPTMNDIGITEDEREKPKAERINITIPDDEKEGWKKALISGGFSEEEADEHIRIANMSRLQKDIHMGKIRVIPVNHVKKGASSIRPVVPQK